MKTYRIKRKLLSAAIAAVAGSLASSVAFAADDIEAEEVIVTGLRASITKAMDIKRESNGVVEAISAEDLGKMPDTNLAESLQRVTGVSIDRSNGEGSRVTVRGFGPDYNLITLNGRQMPAANLEATSASNSRSYDFANLAAESVAGVEVYKTGQAKLSTGGIGSTINIKTARPLDHSGMQATISAKALMDTSNRGGSKGSDITPEISGIFSNTFADDTIGIALNGSYSQRDSGYNAAETSSGWYAIKGLASDWGSLPTNGTVTNRPKENDVYAVPRNIMYSFNDIQRTRTNGQLTLQFKPVDSFTATADYTYAQHKIEQQRQELSAWFNGIPTGGSFTTGTNTAGSVVGPITYSDGSTADIGMGAGDWGIVNENRSAGLNLEWEVSDALTLNLDYHNSTAEAGADDSRGSNNIATAVHYARASATVDYSQEFPALDIKYATGTNGLDPAQFVTSGTSFRNSYMKSDIEQLQLSGTFKFEDSIAKNINFGLSSTDGKNRSAFSNAQRDTWGGYGSAADYPDSLFTRESLPAAFSDLAGSKNPNLEPYFYRVNFDGLLSAISKVAQTNKQTISPCGTILCASPTFSTDRRVEEERIGGFVQANFGTEVSGMPVNFGAGVRYEETDVDAKALVPGYTSITWSGDNEFTPNASGSTFTQLNGAYKNWLPNVDFDIEPITDVKVRLSYSETIARPSYADIQGGQTINSPVRFNGGTGNSGNPNLKPFDSKNYDFSTEWYYAEGSYLSAGYYKKDVKNFIGTTSETKQLFGLATPVGGTRYKEAVTATGSNDPAVLRQYMEAKYGAPIVGDASKGDPLTNFTIISPVNAETAEIHGFEFALQHMFGESGFGGILNITTVNGDVNYDNYNTNRGEGVDNQFALLGLSDSANLVAFYEKNGIQARIAYNWRDKFLTSTFDGNGERNPIYTRDYGQVDVNVSYNITDNLTVMAEGINITDSHQRLYGRHVNNIIFIAQQGPRYDIGVRYKF